MYFDFLVLRTVKERLTCSKNEIGPLMTPATKNWVSGPKEFYFPAFENICIFNMFNTFIVTTFFFGDPNRGALSRPNDSS